MSTDIRDFLELEGLLRAKLSEEWARLAPAQIEPVRKALNALDFNLAREAAGKIDMADVGPACADLAYTVYRGLIEFGAQQAANGPSMTSSLEFDQTVKSMVRQMLQHIEWNSTLRAQGLALQLIAEVESTLMPVTKANPYHDTRGKFTTKAKAVERQFESKMKDYERAKNEYAKLEDSEGGKVLNTDIARELSEAYLKDRTLSAAVHEPASAFIKRIYAEKLAALPEGADVMFTSGGTGAGKTTAISGLGDIKAVKDASDIIYDTNMNTLASAVNKIEQALDAKARVQIVHIYRDPVESFVNGALARATSQERKFGTGRTVPLAEHVKTHQGSDKVVRQLSDLYRDNPNVAITVIDNSRGKGGQRVVPLEELPSYNFSEIEGKLNAALEEAYDSGRISKAIYRGTKAATSERVGKAERVGDGSESEAEVEKKDEGNPYHDEEGRFTTRENDVDGHLYEGIRAKKEPYTDDKGKARERVVWLDGNGKPLPPEQADRLTALKVRPGLTNIRLSRDPNSRLQAQGFDDKGRLQSKYSSEHSGHAKAEKFARVADLNKIMPQFAKKLEDALKTKPDDTLAALRLIERSGIRPGGDEDTGADEQAYGATTLLGEHIKIEGAMISLKFPGKSGQLNERRFRDQALAAYIKTKPLTPGEQVFNTNDKRTLAAMKRLTGDQFKSKDLRTWHGTDQALKAIQEYKDPVTTVAEFAKMKKHVATKVSDFLNNTPAVALESYINPAVFDKYGDLARAIKVEVMDDAHRYDRMNDFCETVEFDHTGNWRDMPETEPEVEAVKKLNPYHDSHGKFTTKDKAAGPEDAINQMTWLDEKAKAFGFKGLEDMEARAPEAFVGLAQEWRNSQGLEPGSKAEGPEVSAVRALTGADIDGLTAEQNKELAIQINLALKNNPDLQAAETVLRYYRKGQSVDKFTREVVALTHKQGMTADRAWESDKVQAHVKAWNENTREEYHLKKEDAVKVWDAAEGYHRSVREQAPQKDTMWRGTTSLQAKVGQEFELRGPTAFSHSQDIAASYGQGTLIRVQPGAKALPTAVITQTGDTVPVFYKRPSNSIHPKGIGHGFEFGMDTDAELTTSGRFKVLAATSERISYVDALTGKTKAKTMKVITVEQTGVF